MLFSTLDCVMFRTGTIWHNAAVYDLVSVRKSTDLQVRIRTFLYGVKIHEPAPVLKNAYSHRYNQMPCRSARNRTPSDPYVTAPPATVLNSMGANQQPLACTVSHRSVLVRLMNTSLNPQVYGRRTMMQSQPLSGGLRVLPLCLLNSPSRFSAWVHAPRDTKLYTHIHVRTSDIQHNG